jgi:hypothetical protein
MARLRTSLRGSTEQFLLVNMFEESCFNPGKDEVGYEQFKAFAQTSETPHLWDERGMRSAFEFSLADRRQGKYAPLPHGSMHGPGRSSVRSPHAGAPAGVVVRGGGACDRFQVLRPV